MIIPIDTLRSRVLRTAGAAQERPSRKVNLYDRFRGNWSLLWVAGRYLTLFLRGLNLRKGANAALGLLEMALARRHPRSRPFVLRLEPTSNCNLRCPRCSTGLGIEPRPKGFLSLDDLDYLIDQVRDHVIFVRLDGNGEPLLHPEITECIRRLKSAGMAVTLSTHLNQCPRGGMRAFVESGIDRVVVAVDGATQEVYQRYRVGGHLDLVLGNLAQLAEERDRFGRGTPRIDLQFLDWGYNTHEVPQMREMARRYRCDRLTIIRPDWASVAAKANPRQPKRCFWLWCVLTVDWQLNYHSCTNAWTYRFPGLNARQVAPSETWNSQPLVEARIFNKDKSSTYIADSRDCMCNRCTDMLVVDRPPGYVCE